MPPVDRGAAVAFILKFARALHAYGMPAPQLEEAMALCAEQLGAPGQFFVTPTSIIFAFGRPEEQTSSFLRVEPGEVNLEKLDLLHGVIHDVLESRLLPGDGSSRVDAIVAQPARYPVALRIVCHGIAAACAACFLGGGVPEVAVGGGVGLSMGLIERAAIGRPRVTRLFEPGASAIGVTLVHLAAAFVPLRVSVATLAGVVSLLPGVTLTIAMNELAVRHLVAGTARLMGAAMTLLTIGFGAAVGGAIGAQFPRVAGQVAALPLASQWIALGCAPLAFVVLFRARPRAAGWVLLSSVAGLVGARTGARLLGPEMGASAGAFIVGILGNLLSRVRHQPAAITVVPGIVLLVPGSLGFRSISDLLNRELSVGLDAALRMAVIALSLVCGLLMANLVLRPRRMS